MGNNYFRFKQFTIHQDDVAMKVCTDACIFGAWVASHSKNAARVLDVGTGTGLLSLLYAQQNPASLIDAIEIDISTARQANENRKASPWADKIIIHPVALQKFHPNHKYDLIIANPPFFENDLYSSDAGRNDAMHSTSLTLEELSTLAAQHLNKQGSFAVLLPYHRSTFFIGLLLKQGLYLRSRFLIKQTPKHDYFRSILCFTTQPVTNIEESELIIKTKEDIYSVEFTGLLKDYYLYL